MIISIGGNPGSGKSTVAKQVAKKLNLKHYSSGDLQRRFAKEKGLTIEELGELETKDEKTDKEVDNYVSEITEKEDNLVIDGWIAFHFAKNSVKVFLECDEDIGAKRIYNDTVENKRDASERKAESFEKAKEIMIERQKTNRERWKRYYDVDFLDRSKYDLVIDTTDISAEQAADKIVEFVKK